MTLSATSSTDPALPLEPALDESLVVGLARAAAEAVCAWLDSRYLGDPRFVFDARSADAACDFFPRFLRHSKGRHAGQPFQLDPWQRAVVRTVFGWKHAATGKRVIRTIYLFIARKNGKSTFAAGLALLLLIADGEPGAEVYSAAADRDQAAVTFDEAARMVAASDPLSRCTETFKRAILCPKLVAVYRVLSADAETKHGLNVHGTIFDELHTQPNRDLVDVLHTAVGAREQSLEVYMTTAGSDRHTICYETHTYALAVRAGTVEDPSFLPVMFFAPEDADWKDPATWALANPSAGTAIHVDYLARECRKAQEIPSYENTFRRLHLNQWTEQATRWLPIDAWDAGALPIDLDALAGRDCFAGLDLSSTQDVTAFVLAFPPRSQDEAWITLPRFFVPAENIKRRAERDRVPYDLWAREGLITATEGDVVDYDAVRAAIVADTRLYRIKEIAYDRWNSSQLVTQLQADGAPMVPFGQGFASMSAPSKELEKLVVSRRLQHGGNKVLRWMASNVAIKDDPAGNIKPAKDRSGDKIDGIVALIMALGRATVAPEKPRSVYEALAQAKKAAA